MKKIIKSLVICLVVILGVYFYNASQVKPEVESSIPEQTTETTETQEVEEVEEVVTEEVVEEAPKATKGQDRSGNVSYDENGYAKQDLKEEVTYYNVKPEEPTTEVEGEKEQTFESPAKEEAQEEIVFSQPEVEESNVPEVEEEVPQTSNGTVVTDQDTMDDLFENAIWE